MSNEKNIVSIALDAETDELLKAAAARKGVSVERYCAEAIGKELAAAARYPDAAGGVVLIWGKPPVTEKSAARLFALRDEIFQGRISSTDSVDLIREARERRGNRQDELGRS